ncbi:MAG TPA: chemotaxis protein CheW [Nitrospira sp.]|nr:chemotaxis protein CheW [Nitrospira sp.]
MSFLIVRYGTRYFALPSDGVRGVLTREEAGNGQTVVRVGKTYHEIDLAQLLSTTLDRGSVDLRTVLFANGDSCGAIRVDEVIGLVDADRDQCRPLPPHFQHEERTWIAGMILFQDKLALILNPEWALGELGEVVTAAPRVESSSGIAEPAGSDRPC